MNFYSRWVRIWWPPFLFPNLYLLIFTSEDLEREKAGTKFFPSCCRNSCVTAPVKSSGSKSAEERKERTWAAAISGAGGRLESGEESDFKSKLTEKAPVTIFIKSSERSVLWGNL